MKLFHPAKMYTNAIYSKNIIEFTKNLLIFWFLFSLSIFTIAQTKNNFHSNIENYSHCSDFSSLVESVSPAVVNIRIIEKISSDSPSLFVPDFDEKQAELFYFFGIPSPLDQSNQFQEKVRSVGSGFIIENNGFILTSAHVVEKAKIIYVTLSNKKEYKAKLIGIDKRTDIGVIKIEEKNLPKLNIGDSSKLRVGEWVLAIGSPFGLENSVTAGIVSAKSRDTGEYLPFIQTDVAVNPGNSGGPLINTKGEVIGINSQIFSNSGGYMGISFAIPIDEAIRISDQLRINGRVTRSRIGVTISEVNKDLAESLGLEYPYGAYVRSVEFESPAEKAGIEAGDIILIFDNKIIEKSSDLPRTIGTTTPGTRHTLVIWRKGIQKKINIIVSDVLEEKIKNKKLNKFVNIPILGITVANLDYNSLKKKNIKHGIEIIQLDDGILRNINVQLGDIIIRVGNKDILNVEQFQEVIKNTIQNQALPIFIRRNDATIVLPIKIKKIIKTQ